MALEKSPFPGWDPYLQRYWRDVHQSLVVYTRDALRRQLPEELRGRVEERVVLEVDERRVEAQTDVPDIALMEWPRAGGGGGTAVAPDEAVAEPIKLTISKSR